MVTKRESPTVVGSWVESEARSLKNVKQCSLLPLQGTLQPDSLTHNKEIIETYPCTLSVGVYSLTRSNIRRILQAMSTCTRPRRCKSDEQSSGHWKT